MPASPFESAKIAQIAGRVNRFEYPSAYQQARTLLEALSARAAVQIAQVRRLCAALLQMFALPAGLEGGAAVTRAPDEELCSIALCADLEAFPLSAMEDALHRRYAQHVMAEPVEQAVNYIHKNFAGNLSLGSVAALVHRQGPPD